MAEVIVNKNMAEIKYNSLSLLKNKDMKKIIYEPGTFINGNKLIRDGEGYKEPGRIRRSGIFICNYCGKEFEMRYVDAKTKLITSCGCRKVLGIYRKHGMSNTIYHSLWTNIKSRCLNKNNRQYPQYGGRGITIYEPWINDFKAFYDYISTLEGYHLIGNGKYELSIDRINNEGNYEPGNIRFATRIQQNNNRRK